MDLNLVKEATLSVLNQVSEDELLQVTLPALRGKVASFMNVETEELLGSPIKAAILEIFQNYLMSKNSSTDVKKEDLNLKKEKSKKKPKLEVEKVAKVNAEKRSSSPEVNIDGKNAQIEKLKSYVFKCGVRKVWKKEFEGFTTEKQCISKLHAILKDLGIEGKPSLEQCKAIKKRREFEAELREIDTSNIIEGKRRASSLIPKKSFKEPISSSDTDNEEEEEIIDLKAFGDSESE